MVPPNKTTLLLVHGAWHGPECFDALIPPLKTAGYFSAIKNDLKLPSAQPNSTSSLQEDINFLRATVLHILDDSDCVVVMHSYGSVPAAEALQGLSRSERGASNTAVVKMVYLTCNILKVGNTTVNQLVDWIEEMGLPSDAPFEATDNGVLKYTGNAEYFYNGIAEDQQASLLANLSTQSAASLTTPLKGSLGSMAYDKIPGWYLISKKDNSLPEGYQRLCIGVVGDGIEHVEEVDAGHSSFIEKPEIVADFIVRAARSVAS